MVSDPSRVSCIGWNGYMAGKNTKNNASTTEYMVFVRYNAADRWILLIVRLPSATIAGMDPKSESISTSWDTFLAASLPDCMAILQSASFNAITSLTPSPVMAMVCPCSFNVFTRSSFCAGVTLPNTVYFSAASLISSGVCKVFASTKDFA